VVTAIRLCEPCSSTSFHIEGSNLVCNTCGTVWSLENLQGLSGGCQKYPPEAMTTSRDGGDAIMSVDEVAAWEPRV
ncbi:MAG: Fe-S-containing protein, partial [Syntrophothermus sp.]